MTGDDQSPRTLYVGNLSPHVTEDLLIALFSQIGECKSCKIIHEPGNDPYAFIEFADSHAAASALSAMNKRNCLGKEMKVNWATTSGHQPKVDSKSFHIFVGDLAPDIDQQTLREAFATFGEISDVKIMKDPHTLAHKGYGFVSFVNKADAELAIAQMNGQWLGSRKIRTNWATRKVQPGGATHEAISAPQQKFAHKLDYNEVWNRSSDNNSTVYCGGINNLTEDLIRSTFGVYGQIIGIHPFPDRGYAFVRFATKEAACAAICGIHGSEINGGIAKCSWGKENIEATSSATPSSSSIMSAMGSSLYNTSATSLLANAGSMQAAAANQLGGANNPWGASTQSSNWANYQWAAAAGYPQNTMNYWNYPGYQNPMAMQQGWGVMPQATGNAAGTNAAQYQMGQYQQGTNGKS